MIGIIIDDASQDNFKSDFIPDKEERKIDFNENKQNKEDFC